MVRDVLDDLYARWATDDAVAVGTVVATFSSAPRPAGAAMIVAEDGTAVGSVSGGCVEGAVYELGQQVLADGMPSSQRYGVSDDDAFTDGLTCGGILDVFVERISPETFPELGEVVESVRAQHPVAIVTVTEHPDTLVGRRLLIWRDRTAGSLGSARIDAAVTEDGRGLLASGRTGTLYYGPEGQRRGEGMSVFVNSFEPPPRMLVFGAVDFARAMTSPSSKPTSQPGSRHGTPTPSPSCGPRPPTTSSPRSPNTANESTTRHTREAGVVGEREQRLRAGCAHPACAWRCTSNFSLFARATPDDGRPRRCYSPGKPEQGRRSRAG